MSHRAFAVSEHAVSRDTPRNQPRSRSGDHAGGDTWLWLPAVLVLALCFVTGGSSSETGTGVMVAEWLSLLLLLVALVRGWQHQRLHTAPWAIAVLALIVLLPLLQLLPLSEWLWQLAPARQALQQDLAAAGVAAIDYRWSLAPLATERDLYLLLPPVALFFAAFAMGPVGWRRMLWCVVALAAFTLVLGFVQLGAAQDSFLNPFPQYKPALTGVFANKNHQADILAIGLVLSLSLLLDHHRRFDGTAAARVAMALCIGLLVLFALVLPLVRSRAGVIIALVVSGFVMLHSGPLLPRHWRQGRASRLVGLAALVVLGVGIWAAFAWMQADVDVAGSRWQMLTTTWHLGFDNLPFGSGFGSFVPMFEQATHGALMQRGYVNNAHNDYVQWWFEGGLLAVVALLAALAVLLVSAARLLRRREGSKLRSNGMMAFSGVLVLLLHSTVDYPLRTPALMAVAGLLCGIVVAASALERRTQAH